MSALYKCFLLQDQLKGQKWKTNNFFYATKQLRGVRLNRLDLFVLILSQSLCNEN